MSQPKKPRAPLHQPGDVFAVALPSGWVGAVRILRRNDEVKPSDTYLLVTTPYLDRELPEISYPKLQQILSRDYSAWAGSLALVWVQGQPPEGFTYLGNLPPTAEELAITCNSFGGAWSERNGDEAYRQWRWDNDREAYVAEQTRASEEFLANFKRARQRQKPKKMLADDDFWGLIALLGPPPPTEERFEQLVDALARRTRTDIKRFEETLAYKLFLLDTKAHADASVNSDDGFLYARCAVVAGGPDYYELVRANPSETPADLEFEDLLSVSSLAFERKTGEDFDYETGCSYETGSNLKEWPDE